MIEYIKEDKKTFKVTTTKVEINVQALTDELAEWEGMTEPSDEDLVEMGRSMHPYYLEKDQIIENLKRKIEEIK